MNRLAISISFAIGMCLHATFADAQDTKKLPDAEVTKLLVGRWLWRPTSKLFIDIRFAENQSFTAWRGAGDFGYEASGTWKLDKGVLEITTKTISIGQKQAEVDESLSQWSILPKSTVISIDDVTLKVSEIDASKIALEFKKAK